MKKRLTEYLREILDNIPDVTPVTGYENLFPNKKYPVDENGGPDSDGYKDSGDNGKN